MTRIKKVRAWLCIVFAYLFTYVTPMIAAYFLLAEDRLKEAEGKSGVVYYIIIGIFGLALIIAFTKTVMKMKANLFKSLFKAAFEIVMLLGIIASVKYIDLNYDRLILLFYSTLGGFGIGNMFEFVAVWRYKEYIREVGVF